MALDALHLDSEFRPDFRYEEIQFFFRRHWVHFLKVIAAGFFIGFMVLIVLLGLYALATAFPAPALKVFFVFAAMIISFVYFNLFLLEVINYFFDLVIVTDHRIIIVRKTVFLKNDSGAIDLTKIQDLSVESRGIIQNYLKYGNMMITLSSATPPIVVECMPHPHVYLERANRVKREHILRRQERKMTPAEPKDYLQDVHDLLKGRE